MSRRSGATERHPRESGPVQTRHGGTRPSKNLNYRFASGA